MNRNSPNNSTLKKTNAIIFDFANVIFFPTSHKTEDTTSMKEISDLRSPINSGLINSPILEYVKKRKKDFITVILSNSNTLLQQRKITTILEPFFDYIFSCTEIGISKRNSESFLTVSNKISVTPQRTIFIDDKLDHVVAAQKAQCHSIRYVTNKQLFEDLKKIKKRLYI